jgi:hypothetical protein
VIFHLIALISAIFVGVRFFALPERSPRKIGQQPPPPTVLHALGAPSVCCRKARSPSNAPT